MSMIEKAARALYAVEVEAAREIGVESPSWEASLHGCRERRRSQVRAVIEALMEPTPEIKLAGAQAITLEMMRAAANYDAACDAWKAMLTAAFNEGEGA